MVRLIFCFNQVSYVIACELARRDKGIKYSIYYCPKRVSVRKVDADLNIAAYTDRNLRWLSYYYKIMNPDEVVLPHFICHKRIKKIAQYAKKVSLIDDGMDTYREKPKNIQLENFAKKTKYYTFNDSIGYATWLQHFELDEVCSIAKLALDDKPLAEFENYRHVIVESPGLQIDDLFDLEGEVLVVQHPSYVKNIFKKGSFQSVPGRNISLEKSLKHFKGSLLVGESMVLVYALSIKDRDFQLSVKLPPKSKNNLQVLVKAVNDASDAHLL